MRADLGGLATEAAGRDLTVFTSAPRVSLAATIKKAPVDHIKKYLSDYIQDLFRQWAEQEGEKVAARLESLAEEFIAVVNEDLRASSPRRARSCTEASSRC